MFLATAVLVTQNLKLICFLYIIAQ